LSGRGHLDSLEKQREQNRGRAFWGGDALLDVTGELETVTRGDVEGLRNAVSLDQIEAVATANY